MEQLRTKLLRAEDKELPAENLTEFIIQHGTHGWVDRLVETAGPTMLYQCEQIADMLEVLQK